MQPQAPVPRVPTNKPTGKPISAALIATPNEPTGKPAYTPGIKPTTLPANLSKHECLCKWQATRLCNAATPTSPTPGIRTRAQVATAAAQVAPPSLNTRSWTQHSGTPPPTCWPGFAAAVMRQQWRQRGLFCLTCRITQLENEVHQAMAVMDRDMGKLLNYRQLMNSRKYKKAWSLSAANKFGGLANGIKGCIENPTNTIEFIFQHEVPVDRIKDVTYGQFVCTVRPEKAETNQMQFTVGGDRINYPGKVATPTAEMLVTKMLFNSVTFMKGARFMTMDISNFYLMTPLHCAEFILIKLSDIPKEAVNKYKLREKATKNGSMYIRAKRGMYGLPQAGLLANKLLEKCLN